MGSALIHDGGPMGAPALSAHSRFVQRIRRRYGAELSLLPPGTFDAAGVSALVQTLRDGGRALPSALRVARQLCLERLACLDVEQAAPLATVTHGMTALAEATLELALAQAQAEAEERHGVPRDAQGRRIEFWIVGMGKLGARELNVSSDIDLIYIYEDEGETDGPVPTSAHEFFSLVAKKLYTLIGETTEDGFVFRVDLALRPNGNSGPPVCSLPMLEDYLQVQGREWERFAWLKSRVVAPAPASSAAARWRCARWSRPSSTAATWTTACSKACASCTARSATRPSAAPPAAPSAPTT
jgi:[glutamine synthetase] adenylyltransferase / [glutamine synthetase]-adenylyl-L-tyrosine phosphorylase